MSNFDQTCEQYGTDTRITPSYKGCARVDSQALLRGGCQRARSNMLWTIFAILVILWLLGFSFHVGGGLIHLLLVGAVIWLVWNLLTRRRSFS
jgi:hypothetical protein